MDGFASCTRNASGALPFPGRLADASIVISGIKLVAKLRKGQFNVARLFKRVPGDINDLWMAQCWSHNSRHEN
jgi:hypothetical protein